MPCFPAFAGSWIAWLRFFYTVLAGDASGADLAEATFAFAKLDLLLQFPFISSDCRLRQLHPHQ